MDTNTRSCGEKQCPRGWSSKRITELLRHKENFHEVDRVVLWSYLVSTLREEDLLEEWNPHT